jgi:SUMO ligase MMS21 Smc5/6 complex component
MLTSIVKKYFASIGIAILTLASLIGIPIKQLANQDNYDPKCVEFGPTIWSKQRAKAYALAYMKVHHPTWTRAH